VLVQEQVLGHLCLARERVLVDSALVLVFQEHRQMQVFLGQEPDCLVQEQGVDSVLVPAVEHLFPEQALADLLLVLGHWGEVHVFLEGEQVPPCLAQVLVSRVDMEKMQADSVAAVEHLFLEQALADSVLVPVSLEAEQVVGLLYQVRVLYSVQVQVFPVEMQEVQVQVQGQVVEENMELARAQAQVYQI
jgi:hypothetical protein